jgi:hypothetical protein
MFKSIRAWFLYYVVCALVWLDARRATLTRIDRAWFVNGSIKGYDPYVSFKNATPQAPKQWFFLVDQKGPTDLAELWVSDREAELKLR